jgi:hypothetical protein
MLQVSLVALNDGIRSLCVYVCWWEGFFFFFLKDPSEMWDKVYFGVSWRKVKLISVLHSIYIEWIGGWQQLTLNAELQDFESFQDAVDERLGVFVEH